MPKWNLYQFAREGLDPEPELLTTVDTIDEAIAYVIREIEVAHDICGHPDQYDNGVLPASEHEQDQDPAMWCKPGEESWAFYTVPKGDTSLPLPSFIPIANSGEVRYYVERVTCDI